MTLDKLLDLSVLPRDATNYAYLASLEKKKIYIYIYVHTHDYTIYCLHTHTCMNTNGIEKIQAVSVLGKVTDVPSSLRCNSQKLET